MAQALIEKRAHLLTGLFSLVTHNKDIRSKTNHFRVFLKIRSMGINSIFFLEIIEVRQENAYLFCLRAEEFHQGYVFKFFQSYIKIVYVYFPHLHK